MTTDALTNNQRPNDNQRPPVWVGHVELETDRLEESKQFMQNIGMRLIFSGEDVVVMELRGGTHLVLLKKEAVRPGKATFDLMVDDIDASHQGFSEMGLSPSVIARGQIHDSFTVTEPAGQVITFNSSHVGNLPV